MFVQTARARPAIPFRVGPQALEVNRSADGTTAAHAGLAILAAPFDAIRFQYACAVMAGAFQRSIVASGRLERALDALEKLMLGPFARRR